MPSEEDYNRRQIQHNSTPASPSPANRGPSIKCAGTISSCVPIALPNDCFIGDVDRFKSDMFGTVDRSTSAPQSSERFAHAEPSSSSSTSSTDRFAVNGTISQSERFASDRGIVVSSPDRFGPERSQSDRLPSGERYQGVSERYPLGERPQTSISSDRLLANQASQAFQNENNRFISYHRYPSDQYNASLERSHSNNTFSRTVTPTSLDRYSTLSSADKNNRSNERYFDHRYHTISHENERSKTGRYTPTDYKIHMEKDIRSKRCGSSSSTNDRYVFDERQSSSSSNINYGETTTSATASMDNRHHQKGETRERSGSGDRKASYQFRSERYNTPHHQDSFQNDRYPPIPCPERFASEDIIQYSETTYLEPPSPAPASDRFIPPPPISPESTPTTPGCFTSNVFPTATQDRFVSTSTPLASSAEGLSTISPNKNNETRRSYHQYGLSDKYGHQPHQEQNIFKDHHHLQFCNNNNSERYQLGSNERYEGRYGPQNPHMPVERYVPQQQYDEYYPSQYDRYPIKLSSHDPYMRRDLANFQYRLPLHLNQNNQLHQKIRYVTPTSATSRSNKCCQYSEGYHNSLPKSSPGSSSSNSSVASQNNKDLLGPGNSSKEVPIALPACVNNVNISLQDIQCQNFKTNYHQQEKGTQCAELCNSNSKECVAFVSPNLRVIRGQCRHSICVSPSIEYVGNGGGRHNMCVTPPPRSGLCTQETICNDACCTRRGQTSLTVAIWRSSPAQSQSPPNSRSHSSQDQSTSSSSTTTTSSANDDQERTTESISPHTDSSSKSPCQRVDNGSSTSSPSPILRGGANAQPQQTPVLAQHIRAISMPASSSSTTNESVRTMEQRAPKARGVNYSQSERIPNRPALERSTSRKEIIKNYIKRETATFFGVGDNEQEQQNIWLDRRKRMASRAYGPLKEEYRTSTLRSTANRSVVSEQPARLPTAVSGQLVAERPDVLPGLGGENVVDSTDGRDGSGGVTLRRKESVARMTWDGLSYVVTTLTRHRPRPRSQQNQWSRSFPADTPAQEAMGEESTFFEPTENTTLPRLTEGAADMVDRGDHAETAERAHHRLQERYTAPGVGGWRRTVPREGQRQTAVGKNRITNCLDHLLDNSDRRQYGMGWVGRMFGRTFKKSIAYNEKIQEQLDDLEDHRPMFTYWVTIVQILVLFISLFCYGFGPFGIDRQTRSARVMVTSLSLQQVDYLEPANFWFGPRAADLIYLGAKFAPCMRVDAEIEQEINKIRSIERETACCIRNDDSGCVQSSKADCSETISTWKKWPDDTHSGGRISGSVCGLDPKFCDAPASVHPYEWPDDITKWPICRKTNASKQNRTRIDSTTRDKHLEHMVCEIIARPCCIGIHGQCRITTKEYCEFVRGTFHEDASLCSQVSCLKYVCGMLPFYFPDTPDQFYRLWTSLFLHAGILQLALTIVIHHFLMRDLEKLTGSLRICLIYMGSGVAGNLASAIFVPYRADVGPAGSQFGLLACLIVEVLNAWPMLKHPKRALFKLFSITFALFIVGLLPWVDNYAHLFGFIFGFLLSYALLPFISFGTYDRQKKIILIWVCLLSAGILFIFLVILFYVTPVYNCKICSYFNCLPLTRDFCASQNINFKREEPAV